MTADIIDRGHESNAAGRRTGGHDKVKMKPMDLRAAVTKEAADRLRGLQWVNDPERGPEHEHKKAEHKAAKEERKGES
ncbi:MAG TPA: hypothetical protein GXX51_11375 [Firmicutes bacterium]|nr:hypothetical protein [Bacillota bacterium]